MTPADRPKFLEIVVGFAELKGKQLSAPALELYWRSMQHWRIADFQAAASQLLGTCAFMPTPKEFEDLRKAGRVTPGEAWTRAVAHARDLPVSGGYLQERDTGDADLDAAVRSIGGYRAIAESEALHFLERRFVEHFEEIRVAEDTREAVPQLAGPSRQRIAGPAPIAKLLASRA